MPRAIVTALVLFVLAFAPVALHAEEARQATLYKDPSCGCCTEYGRYLEANGYQVTVVDSADELDGIKAKYGVPEHLQGCHSTVIEGYVIEGHVPVAAISRLLREKPSIPGISLPGMPLGSPGMSGAKEGAFEIFVIADEEKPPLYATE